jgi:adenine-specific DNA-methyltransferase
VTQPKDDIVKFDLRSEDVAEARRQELLRIFPEAHTESGGINFEALRLSLGDAVESGPEGFGMSWPGKVSAVRMAQQISTGTLLPVVEKSVSFDDSENILIEGDNLEVLKVLQKAYLGKVKMIYIDPPYNTGNDFIYPDNFSESLQTYLEFTGQIDSEGRRFSTNTESSGRFHSKWLNMMYPRLALARTLLRDDGVMLVSIGETEASNLDQLLKVVFGDENIIGRFLWTYSLSENQGIISNTHEYIFVAAKDISKFTRFRLTLADLERLGAEVSDACFRPVQAKNPMSEIVVPAGTRSEKTGDFSIPKGVLEFGVATCEFLDQADFDNGILQKDIRVAAAWTMKSQILAWFHAKKVGDGEVLDSKGQKVTEIYFSSTGRLSYRKERSQQSKVSSHISDPSMTYVRGRAAVEQLFEGDCPFDYPKPPELMRRFVELVTDENDIILDFFAGSGTTAQGVVSASIGDSLPRKWILVQLPEQILESVPSQASAAKWCRKLSLPPLISELTRERLKRLSTLPPMGSSVDTGFRYFELAPSNFAVWDANAVEGDETKLEQQLFAQVEHVLPGRTNKDILFELMLKSRYELTTPVEQVNVGKCEVWKVAGGELVAIIDSGLTIEVIREVASWQPVSVVILDRCFGADDSLKANARKIFEDSKVDLKTV